MKEQIRVSTEYQNIISVRGERLIAGNKWSRFLEDFQVLEDSEMNSSVVHKPQDTTLLPKPSSFDTPNQSNPQKGHAEVPPPVVADCKNSEPQKRSFIETPKVVEKRNERRHSAGKDKESKQKQRIQTSHAENGAFATERFKKAVKGIAERNEERQLLVNMGAAVLIIVAISAYATYKFT
ncbi:hypothetical protein CDL12_09786 [Handroanthus impetiginosus]|uniref:Uncharacterized protein n=1 Tax=Handroanthus impetiginosus TaxID=429701 RepID=A0A2G9HJ47_9LAMI|nr:hypothetical protein CDL12_09786 [Handroanthus impetiginosus]